MIFWGGVTLHNNKLVFSGHIVSLVTPATGWFALHKNIPALAGLLCCATQSFWVVSLVACMLSVVTFTSCCSY